MPNEAAAPVKRIKAMTPQAIGSMIATIAAQIEAVLPSIGEAAKAKPELMQQITEAVDDLRVAAQSFSDAESKAQAQDTLTRIQADTNAMLAALAQMPLPPRVANVMRIAQLVLPMLEVTAGMIIAAMHTSPSPGPAA